MHTATKPPGVRAAANAMGEVRQGRAVLLQPWRFWLRLFCNVVVCLIGLFLKWQEKEKKGDGEKKKRGGMEEAVEVKLDMHCEGCAQKVRKAVKRLEGNNTRSTPLPFFSQSRCHKRFEIDRDVIPSFSFLQGFCKGKRNGFEVSWILYSSLPLHSSKHSHNTKKKQRKSFM